MMRRYLRLLMFISIGLMASLNMAFAQEAVKVTAVGEKKYQEYSLAISKPLLEDAKRHSEKSCGLLFQNPKKRMFKDLEESIYENIDDFVIEAAVQQKKMMLVPNLQGGDFCQMWMLLTPFSSTIPKQAIRRRGCQPRE